MSTLAPFAGIDALINQGVASTLADSVATFNGGEPFAVLFDARPASFEGMVESPGPEASFDLAKAPGLAVDAELAINGVPYIVTGGVTPDSSGWVTVQLQKAA